MDVRLDKSSISMEINEVGDFPIESYTEVFSGTFPSPMHESEK